MSPTSLPSSLFKPGRLLWLTDSDKGASELVPIDASGDCDIFSYTLPASSIRPGRIFWLADPDKGQDEYSDSDSDGERRLRIKPRTMYGHPVMVLHNVGVDNVAVCLLTTLNDRDLEVKKRPFDNEFYLAIHPKEPPCAYLYPQLHLDRDVTLRKPSYLCIRQRFSVHRNMLELYDNGRPADYYQMSHQSYMIVATTFRMNISIPEELTSWETVRGMLLRIVEAQSSATEKAVTLPRTPFERIQSTIVQAPQDRRVANQVSTGPNTTAQDPQITEGSPTTQDRPTPVQAERTDELVGTRNETSGDMSLSMGAIRYSGASAHPFTNNQYYRGRSGSGLNYPSWWPSDTRVFESECAAREAWHARLKKQR